MEDISHWDADYLQAEVLPSVESAAIEKKAEGKFAFTTLGKVAGETTAELAKQVSGFANSGTGFIVYGITNDNKLDIGVPTHIGRQPIKDWVEAIIPKLVYPELTTCEAVQIRVPNHHAADRCVLAVQILLSEKRPHWTLSPNEIAYLRAGSHTVPMRPQSLLDIASRQGGSAADIFTKPNQTPNFSGVNYTYHMDFYAQLLHGRVCHNWSLDLRVIGPRAHIGILASGPEMPIKTSSRTTVSIEVAAPLFASRLTRVPVQPIAIHWEKRNSDDREITLEATLYLDSGFSVTKRFGLETLDPSYDAAMPFMRP